MLQVFRCFVVSAFLGYLSLNGQYIEPKPDPGDPAFIFAMDWSYGGVKDEFGGGGLFEGFRHATTAEAWFIFQQYYGYDLAGTLSDNSGPALDLILDFGNAFTSSSLFITSTALIVVEDQSIFDIHVSLNQDPEAQGEFLGWIGHGLVGTTGNDTQTGYMGQLLIQTDLLATPIPEPAQVAGVMLPAGLCAWLLIRRLRHGRTARRNSVASPRVISPPETG